MRRDYLATLTPSRTGFTRILADGGVPVAIRERITTFGHARQLAEILAANDTVRNGQPGDDYTLSFLPDDATLVA